MPLIDLPGLGHFKDRENAMIAENFSATKAYAVGDYCYYNGTLYRFKTAHAAGAWTTSDVEAAKLAHDVSDLKESFTSIHAVETMKTASTDVSRVNYWIDSSGVIKQSNYSIILPVSAGKTYKLSTTSTYGTNYALLKDTDFTVNSAPNYANGYTGRVMIAKDVEATFTASDDAQFIIIRADNDAMQNAITLLAYVDLNTLVVINGCTENTQVLQNKETMKVVPGIGTTGTKFISNESMYLAYIPCEQMEVYSVGKMADNRFAVMWTKEVPAVDVQVFGYISDPTATNIDITTGAGAKYLCVYYYASGTSTNTEADLYNSLSVTFKGYSAIDRVARAAINPNNIEDLYIVSKTGNYKTITSAINVAPANSTILIMPGTYEEQIDAKNKNIHLIGYNRETCIILDKSGMYDTPPIEISGGSIQNLTIIETGENSTPSSSGTLPTLAYCIHADWNAMENNTLVVSNCSLKCNKRATIGVGARNGFKLIIENCDMWSGVQEDTSHDARGTFFIHTLQTGTNTTGTELIMRNNRITCEDSVVMCLLDEGGIHVSCDLENNNLYSAIDGVNNSIVKGANNQNVSFSTTLIKQVRCYGNNISVINT